MTTLFDTNWNCRGMSLLWDIDALLAFASISEVKTMQQFFHLDPWPQDLPSNNGRALIVAGLDACLDTLSKQDAETWLEEDLKSRIIQFQDEYETSAALVFWLPTGKSRVLLSRASGTYSWRCDAIDKNSSLRLGKCLWAGAESDALRILKNDSTSKTDPDGAWIGLHHPRIS